MSNKNQIKLSTEYSVFAHHNLIETDTGNSIIIKKNENYVNEPDRFQKYNIVNLNNLHKLKIIKYYNIYRNNKNFDILNKYYYLFYFIKFDSPENLLNLLCQACYDIVNSPVKCTNCGKMFCVNCVTIDDLCPLECQQNIPKNKIKIRKLNVSEEERFEDFDVFCINRRYGCTCEFKLRNYTKHYYSCNFIFNRFIYYKSSGIFGLDIDNYILNELKKLCIMVKCLKCSSYIDLSDLNDHFAKNCENKNIIKESNIISLEDIDEGSEEDDKKNCKKINNKLEIIKRNKELNKIFINIRREKLEQEIHKIKRKNIGDDIGNLIENNGV